MADKLHHERLYRGDEALGKLRGFRIVVCGAGALGSNLVEGLSRQGFDTLRIIDNDRVEEHNLSTQAYGESDIGALKVEALKTRVFRAVGVEIETDSKRLDDRNAARLLRKADLVVDAFDNSASRQAVQDVCRANSLTCLHAGLFEDYGEVIWDAHYRVPKDAGEDLCDYPLARNLAVMVATLTCETIVRFRIANAADSRSITLRDLSIQALETE
ncbi:MAG: ThiF family adenylyltransferase [Planctomycetota bacterium]